MNKDRKEDVVIDALLLLVDYCATEGINLASCLDAAKTLWKFEENQDAMEAGDPIPFPPSPASSDEALAVGVDVTAVTHLAVTGGGTYEEYSFVEGDIYALLGNRYREEMHVRLEEILSNGVLVRGLGAEVEYVVEATELRPIDDDSEAGEPGP